MKIVDFFKDLSEHKKLKLNQNNYVASSSLARDTHL